MTPSPQVLRTDSDLTTLLQEAPRSSLNSALIPIGTLASGSAVGIPVIVAKGRRVAPVLWINGGVHGNESPGSTIIAAYRERLEQHVRDGMLEGTVVLTPFANPTALDNRLKASPYDNVDMDEIFPGKDLLITHKSALSMMNVMEGVADYVVSVHTNGTPLDAEIYTVFKSGGLHEVPVEELHRLMAAFAPSMMCEMRADNAAEVTSSLLNSLDGHHLASGVPAFMLEVGGGGVWKERICARALDGFDELARRTRVLDGQASPPADHLVVDARRHVTAPMGGLFRPSARPGGILPKGTSAGRIYSPHGTVAHDLVFDQDVVLISVRKDPTTHVGDRIAFIGTEWHRRSA